MIAKIETLVGDQRGRSFDSVHNCQSNDFLLFILANYSPQPYIFRASAMMIFKRIVELLSLDLYEVEFSDDNGQTYTMLPLHSSQFIQIHYQVADS